MRGAQDSHFLATLRLGGPHRGGRSWWGLGSMYGSSKYQQDRKNILASGKDQTRKKEMLEYRCCGMFRESNKATK